MECFIYFIFFLFFIINLDGSGGVELVGNVNGKRRVRKKDGGRGKIKQAWTVEERRVLWECFVRSGGKKSGGYINKIKEMWDGRDLSVRGIPSLVAQLKLIETNNLLTVVERGEIERQVLRVTMEVVEEDMVDFVLEEAEYGNEVRGVVTDDEGGFTLKADRKSVV